MSDDAEYEDYDDDMEIYLEATPLSKYHFVEFLFTFWIGVVRSLLEALCNLGNHVTGAQVYESSKKEFENEARLEMETIWNDGKEDGS